MIPRATYRLQLHRGFPFEAAAEIVPYLAQLGISHVYTSPILAARSGSPHGYDVIDHSKINSELGGEAGLRRLCAKLRQFDLKLIVDFVPNHMAADAGNAWWLDVLEKGRTSEFANHFDIDWGSEDPLTDGKVLAPFLGAPYGEELEAGTISLLFDQKIGKLAFSYHQHRFPLREEDCEEFRRGGETDPELVARANNPADLHRLLERQHFRLCWWKTAVDAINWRRFFDINDLIGLRIEQSAVFEAVHARIWSLVAEDLIDGVRIDHVDGLADPAGYCRSLRARLDQIARTSRPYIVVEKILGKDEVLDAGWRVDGTSGYDFLGDVSALQHDPRRADPLARIWSEISSRPDDFDAEERVARTEALAKRFEAPLSATAAAFGRLRAGLDSAADLSLASIRRALVLLIGEMRTYRTYATGRVRYDNANFESAVSEAQKRSDGIDRLALAFVARVVRGEEPPSDANVEDAVRRFNQIAATVAAKAVEDTAFYRYGRLLSRNDVGCSPGVFSLSPGDLHARLSARAACFPHTMLATGTHDHKRGEDARARLAVLSEIPDAWTDEVAEWFRLNTALRESLLDAGDEYQLYQTLVGAWPPAMSPEEGTTLSDRMERWHIKSLREAGLRSSWSDPDSRYESASVRFVRGILDPKRSGTFLSRLHDFVTRIAPAGALNGLVQTTLRCTLPGVPDLFQGAELWDFSLVDPDNRRSVDFPRRRSALEKREPIDSLLAVWPDGRVKLELIQLLLLLRSTLPTVFEQGDYVPLETSGTRGDNVLAFARRHNGHCVVVAVPRLCARACMDSRSPLPPAAYWSNTEIVPPVSRPVLWRSMLDDAARRTARGCLPCTELFEKLPVAVLVSRETA